MSAPQARNAGLTDWMILVAAIAVGLSINKVTYPNSAELVGVLHRGGNERVLVILGVALPHVICLSYATLTLRLRKPRPGLVRIARQPGMVACVTASACVALLVCLIGANLAVGRDTLSIQEMVQSSVGGRTVGVFEPLWPLAFATYGDRVGFAVAGAWLAQRLLGCWRPEPSWIDRLGRALGATWVLAAISIWLRTLLMLPH